MQLTPRWLLMPIVVLEFLGGLINLLVFGPVVGSAPCALMLDALVVPTVMGGKAKSPIMRWLSLRFVQLVQNLELDVVCGHEFGPFNPICDAGSRGKVDDMEAIMRNLGLELEYVDLPDAAIGLMNQTLDEWLRLSEADRAAARTESSDVNTIRRSRILERRAADIASDTGSGAAELAAAEIGKGFSSCVNGDGSTPHPASPLESQESVALGWSQGATPPHAAGLPVSASSAVTRPTQWARRRASARCPSAAPRAPP